MLKVPHFTWLVVKLVTILLRVTLETRCPKNVEKYDPNW